MSVIALVPLAGIGMSSSCYTQGTTTCGQENEPLAPLRGRVFAEVIVTDDAGLPVRDDAGNVIPVLEVDEAGNPKKDDLGRPIIKRAPQPGTTVFVELCGLYTENPDPAKAHPNYRYGTLTRDDGTFELLVPKGQVGLHTFKLGWLYGRTKVLDSTVPVADFTELAARGVSPPTLSNLVVGPTEASPGEKLSFSVDVRVAQPDPMSEELVVFETSSNVAVAFAPPRRGVPKKGWPEGTWTATMPAPSAPGRYTFIVQSTSEQCVSSNRLSTEVVVR